MKGEDEDCPQGRHHVHVGSTMERKEAPKGGRRGLSHDWLGGKVFDILAKKKYIWSLEKLFSLWRGCRGRLSKKLCMRASACMKRHMEMHVPAGKMFS